MAKEIRQHIVRVLTYDGPIQQIHRSFTNRGVIGKMDFGSISISETIVQDVTYEVELIDVQPVPFPRKEKS